jgi:cbb3-type cytochrome oxidase maturation protein
MTESTTYLAIATVIGIVISALLAFWWAGHSGQFQEIERGAMALFDTDEIIAGKIEPEANANDSNF